MYCVFALGLITRIDDEKYKSLKEDLSYCKVKLYRILLFHANSLDFIRADVFVIGICQQHSVKRVAPFCNIFAWDSLHFLF